MKLKGRREEPKTPVPGYIVTFSDMITLLLTFFVMLLSMAACASSTTAARFYPCRTSRASFTHS